MLHRVLRRAGGSAKLWQSSRAALFAVSQDVFPGVAAPSRLAPCRKAHAETAVNPLVTVQTVGFTSDNSVVRVAFDDGTTSRFHALWLRDHCPCPLCVGVTKQKSIDFLDIPEGITPSNIDVNVEKGGMRVEWSEGPHASRASPHVSEYSSEWLRAHSYWANTSGGETLPTKPTLATDPATDKRSRVLWKTAHFGSSSAPDSARFFPSVHYDDFMATTPFGLYTALCLLRDYGFVRIEGLPVSMEATEEACRRIAFLRESLYGSGMWRTEVKADGGNDTAFSTIPLAAHTDGNYLDDSPGVQTFHCLKADPTGGLTLLVDGFAVAEELRAKHPDTFRFFCNLQLPFHHTDPDWQFIQWKKVFELDDEGDLGAIHFNNDDRAHLALRRYGGGEGSHSALSQPITVPLFYRHYRVLLKTIRSPELELWMQLQPGTLLVFDNTRVMHGRSGLSKSSGRVLAGCYINREEWHSKLRSVATKLGIYKSGFSL